MKLNKKGFTLIELLAVIIIISLVIGFSTYGIIQTINNSKEKKILINERSIKEAARIYSGEVSSDSWKRTGEYDVFCVTIGELMNKGLLDKNIQIDGKYGINNYVLVKRNIVTLMIQNEEILSTDNYDICTG